MLRDTSHLRHRRARRLSLPGFGIVGWRIAPEPAAGRQTLAAACARLCTPARPRTGGLARGGDLARPAFMQKTPLRAPGEMEQGDKEQYVLFTGHASMAFLRSNLGSRIDSGWVERIVRRGGP